MNTLAQDLRFAIRTLWKSPTFTAIALLALALGIGANSAIFTVVNSVLFQPLPFPQSNDLYSIATANARFAFRDPIMLDPDRDQLERHDTSFEQIGAYSRGQSSMTGYGEPIPVHGRAVTPGFWEALRVNAALGRTFLPEERDGSQHRVAVLSNDLWRTHFRSDRSIVGKSINLGGDPHIIIGVMPPGFTFPGQTDLWTPVIPAGPGNVFARAVFGRLKPGVSSQQAQAEAEAIIRNAEPDSKEIKVTLSSMRQALVGRVRPSLLILFGAVGFILLIACANVANLLLARGAGRRQEIAVRASLGATRWRLARQLLTESSLLALFGGALGLLIALWAVPSLMRLTPPGMLPRFDEVSVNARVLGFTVVLSLLTSVLFGIAPALQLSKARLAEFLKQADRRITGGQKLRGILVAAEIALSLVLLIGAGLMIKSFLLLRSVNPGFNPGQVLVMTLNLPENAQLTAQRMIAYHREAIDKLAALPGAISAGSVNWLPLDQALIMGDFQAQAVPKQRTGFNVAKPVVSPDYFRTMGIRLVQGRSFDARDSENAPAVVIVSQTVARQVWGDENPIGKLVTSDDEPQPTNWMTVVGVVDDVKQENLSEKEPMPAIYKPLAQTPHPFFLAHMAYAVRTSANPSATARLMRARFRELDANQPIQSIAPMDDLLDATTAEPRFYSRMLGSFSAIALLLASAGIYGVMAYSVVQRTREIGIRIALGAKPRDIFRSVMGRSGMLIAAGVSAGLLGAYGVTRVLEKLLFEVKPTDAPTFAIVTGVLVAIAFLASYIPAKRATAVDPMVALRYE